MFFVWTKFSPSFFNPQPHILLWKAIYCFIRTKNTWANGGRRGAKECKKNLKAKRNYKKKIRLNRRIKFMFVHHSLNDFLIYLWWDLWELIGIWVEIWSMRQRRFDDYLVKILNLFFERGWKFEIKKKMLWSRN